MAGGFLSGLKTLIEELGGSVTVDERLNNRKIPVGPLSTGSGFAIPCLAAGKTAPYAILIDFGNHKINGDVTNKKGVNFADIIKATEEVTLEDITILTSLDSRTIPQSQLKTQAEWLAMAKNGLPSSATFDVFRNQRLRQSEWDDEWRRILTTPVPRSSSSSSPAQPQIAGINYNKLKWPSEKGRIPWSGLEYDLTLLDEDEDYCMSGGTVYLTNGHNYDWRIIVRNGKTYSYDFDPGLFSSWRECDTYEEMLEEIIQYDADN